MTRILVQLLDEGTTVFRPTEGVDLGGGNYLVVATPDYAESEEVWEFPPGTVVVCEPEIKSGKEVLVAKRLA